MQAIIRRGKVNGRPIIRAWESYTGWYWFATEQVEDDIYFGFVVGIYPEWGYFSAKELANLGELVWEVKKKDIPFINRKVSI